MKRIIAAVLLVIGTSASAEMVCLIEPGREFHVRQGMAAHKVWHEDGTASASAALCETDAALNLVTCHNTTFGNTFSFTLINQHTFVMTMVPSAGADLFKPTTFVYQDVECAEVDQQQ